MNRPLVKSPIFIAIVLASLSLCVLIFHYIVSPRLVAHVITPDGIEMCIVQRLTSEGFQTSFYFRNRTGPWGFFYYDHEDNYWSRAHSSLNTNLKVATFFRNNVPVITFDWGKTNYMTPHLPWVGTDPMWMPTGWSPRTPVN